MKTINCKISSIVILLLFAFSVYAQETNDKKLSFAIGAGCFFKGKVQGSYEIDYPADQTVTIKNSLSPLLKINADYKIHPKFSIGGNINFAKFTIDDIIFDDESLKLGNEVSLGFWDGREHIIVLDDIKLLEINGSVKYLWQINEKIILKPCLYLGYRRSFSSSKDGREDGIVLNYNFEFQYNITSKHFIIAEFGCFSQPFGGVRDVAYVRSFGVPYLSIGYGFSIK